jgi:hypothetical protein
MHKILAPGLRLGWMSAGRWQDRVRMLKYAQSRPNELLGQAMVAGFLATGQMPRHLRELRRRLAPQRLQMAEALAAELPEGTRLTLPAGGLALWVELPPGLSSLRLFDAALREGLRLSPGAMFSNDERFDGFLRINCGQPMEPAQRDAVRTLGRLCRQQLDAAAPSARAAPACGHAHAAQAGQQQRDAGGFGHGADRAVGLQVVDAEPGEAVAVVRTYREADGRDRRIEHQAQEGRAVGGGWQAAALAGVGAEQHGLAAVAVARRVEVGAQVQPQHAQRLVARQRERAGEGVEPHLHPGRAVHIAVHAGRVLVPVAGPVEGVAEAAAEAQRAEAEGQGCGVALLVQVVEIGTAGTPRASKLARSL